jgi:Tfp pilus assembly protein PilF
MDRIEKLLQFLAESKEDAFLKHALALEYVKIGELQKARTLFEEILFHDPAYIGSYYHLAKLLEALNENSLAITWYEKGMLAAQQAGDQHSYGELRSALEELSF